MPNIKEVTKVEGNKIIAEFDQKEEDYDEHGVWQKLNYHSNWNLLMPIIEKISRIRCPWSDAEISDTYYPRTFGMLSPDGKPMVRINANSLHTADSLIQATWLAVIDFITYYNQTKTP